MKVTLPDDCGNSPRMALVSQFAVDWAAHDVEALHEHLADGARWSLVGEQHTQSPIPVPPLDADSVEVITAISHGKVAACDGHLLRGSERLDFCHVFRFAGAAKTAKITEIRSYLIPSSSA